MRNPLFLNKFYFRSILSLFLLIFLIAPFRAHGGDDLAQSSDGIWDLKVGLNGRTYPIGAQAIVTGGYNHRLWGDTSSWKYGYVRAALNGATSTVVNRIGPELQIFPISILGFSAGYDWGVRNITMKFLNCEQFECNGRVDRKYFKINALGAYKNFILSYLFKYENLRAPIAQKPLFDEVTLLVGRSSGEDTITMNPALLYTVNEAWKLGVTSVYSRAIDTGGYTHLYGPIANWANQRWNVIGGVGLNRSPIVHSGWAAFFVVGYTLQPSLAVGEMTMRFRN